MPAGIKQGFLHQILLITYLELFLILSSHCEEDGEKQECILIQTNGL